MAEIKQDKKRNILEFIEERSEKGEYLDLTRREIRSHFSDYNSDQIDDILDELEEDDDIETEKLKTEILIPKSIESKVRKEIGGLIYRNNALGYFALGWAIFGFLAITNPIFPFTEKFIDSNSRAVWYLYGATITPVSMIVLADVMPKISEYFQEKIPFFKSFRPLIYSISSLLILGAVSLAGGVLWLGLNVDMTSIVSIVTGAVIGGYYLEKWASDNVPNWN